MDFDFCQPLKIVPDSPLQWLDCSSYFEVTLATKGQLMGRYNGNDHSKDENDNHSDQMNPNNDTYWTDRGHDERPDDWESVYDDD